MRHNSQTTQIRWWNKFCNVILLNCKYCLRLRRESIWAIKFIPHIADNIFRKTGVISYLYLGKWRWYHWEKGGYTAAAIRGKQQLPSVAVAIHSSVSPVFVFRKLARVNPLSPSIYKSEINIYSFNNTPIDSHLNIWWGINLHGRLRPF
jgi:hypothetical protein